MRCNFIVVIIIHGFLIVWLASSVGFTMVIVINLVTPQLDTRHQLSRHVTPHVLYRPQARVVVVVVVVFDIMRVVVRQTQSPSPGLVVAILSASHIKYLETRQQRQLLVFTYDKDIVIIVRVVLSYSSMS